MAMPVTCASVRRWAHDILRELGAPEGHTLEVVAADPGGGAAGRDVSVLLASDQGCRVEVCLSTWLGEAEAIAHLAGQMQDEVLENTYGVPVPPCPGPGHGHPLTAQVLDGVACWTCPLDTAVAPRPIAP